MCATLDSAVHDHVDLVADGIHDFSQLIEPGARAVELPAAMVGQHDAGASDLDGAPGIGDRHDALQAELPVPLPHHFGDIVPIHGGVEHFGEIASDRHGAAA